MTSSLVGSEMCIRDSTRTYYYLLLPTTVDYDRYDRLQPTTTYNDPPVSYTHLTLPTICSV
eukprot:5006943-Prorocentrum_lima.AAC.1